MQAVIVRLPDGSYTSPFRNRETDAGWGVKYILSQPKKQVAELAHIHPITQHY